jgi:two-component system, NarL family, response regulator NreC
MNELRILIADQSVRFRRRLRALLDKEAHWQVVGEAAKEGDLPLLADKTNPDVILMDFSTTVPGDLESATKILSAHPNVKIITLSTKQEEERIRLSFESGVRGYVLKMDFWLQIVAAIRTVCQGRRFLDGRVSDSVLRGIWEKNQSPIAMQAGSYHLTIRELEIVRLLALGDGNRKIAGKLGIRVRTVETHRANIMRKLNLHTLAELIHYAIIREIIHLPAPAPLAAENRALV